MSAYKVFSSAAVQDDLNHFERLVDDWLREQRPHIVALAQSALGSHLILSIIYEADDEAMLGAQSAEVPEIFERTMEQTNLDPASSSDVLLPEAELPY